MQHPFRSVNMRKRSDCVQIAFRLHSNCIRIAFDFRKKYAKITYFFDPHSRHKLSPFGL